MHMHKKIHFKCSMTRLTAGTFNIRQPKAIVSLQDNADSF